MINPESNQISFLASPAVLKTITGLVEKLDAAASRPPKMISYPVYGIVPTTLAESLQKVYPAAKIEVDAKGRRLLIWAALDEHVRISDEIAQVNGKNAPGEQGDTGIRVATFVVPNQSQARQADQIIKALVPGAEIFVEPALYSLMSNTRITVVATVMEQRQIEKMFEQINTPANDNPLELVCYPFGNANPITIETLLHGLLLSADSLSPQKLKEGIMSPARLRSQYRQTIANNDTAHPFFRVDPHSKIVAIFATQADHQRAKKAIETVAALDESQSKLVSKIYTLTSPIASTLLTPLRELVPGAQLTSESPTEIIAFASMADISKLDEFIAGVADTQVVNSRHKMRLVVIPENTLYPRTRIIGIMTVQFRDSGGQIYAGAHSNQLVLWGHKDVLDKMQAFLEETFKQTIEEVYKSYMLKNMEPHKAVEYLEKMCPNATYESDTEKRSVTAFGTPFVQQQIVKALETLDAPRPKDQELIVRYYTFDETVPAAFRTTWRTLHAQFPSISIVPDFTTYQLVVTATTPEHEKIDAFIKSLHQRQKEFGRRLEVYYLVRMSPAKVFPIFRESIPRAEFFIGKAPNEIFVWGNALEHERALSIVSKLETAQEGKGNENYAPRIYKLNSRIAKTAVAITQPSVPAALMYPISGSRLIVWGAPADHDVVAKILDTFAQAYPETIIRSHPLKEIQTPAILPFLQRRYGDEAAFASSEDGNTLTVEAPEIVQKQIEAAIKAFDVPSDAVATPVAVAYDITDIPATSRPGAMTNLRAMIPDGRLLPTTTPGSFVVYAKPATQEKVAAIVKTLLTEQPWLKARLETYSIRNATLAQIISILSPLVPNARYGAGTQANQLIVWAKGSDHDKIKESLDKLNQDAADPVVVRIYRFEVGNLTIAANTITTHFPQVVCYPDVRGRTLSVQATASEQEKIAAMIQEFDRVDDEKQTSLQVFNIGSLDYGKFGKALLNFYARDPDFDIQYDATYRSLIVRGTARQRQTVADLLQKIQEGGFADPEATFKSYTLKNSYSYVTLRRVFDEQGKVPMMQIDFSSGKLIVYASPAEHKVVEQILQTLAPEDTTLAIFDLVYASPETAQFVITNMLESDGSFIDVQLDPSTNQLYVRATPKKLEEIRQILIRMGEAALQKMQPFDKSSPQNSTQGMSNSSVPVQNTAASTAAGVPTAAAAAPGNEKSSAVNANTNANTEKPLRTLKTRADAEKILEEVQKIWKRKNELKIIKTQQDSLIQTKSNPAGAPASAKPAPAKPTEAPKPATAAPATAPAKPADAPKPATAAPAPAPAKPAEAPKPATAAPAPAPAKPAETPKPASAAPAPASAKPADAPKPATAAPAATPAKPAETPKPATTTPATAPAKPADAPKPATTTPTAPAPAKPADAPKPASAAAAPASAKPAETPKPATTTPATAPAKPADAPKPATTAPAATPAKPADAPKPATTTPTPAPAKPAVKSASWSPRASMSSLLTQLFFSRSLTSVLVADEASGEETLPGVYAVVNADGTLTITSSDPGALNELEKAVHEIDARLASPGPASSIQQPQAAQDTIHTALPLLQTPRVQDERNVQAMIRQNRSQADQKLVMQGRDYSVYKVENVSVTLMLPRLQTFLGEKLNPSPSRLAPSTTAARKGINFGTITQGPRIALTSDINMNTIMVKGSKIDRDEVGAMIVVLDKTELFPEPITKPYKIRVRNTTVDKMVQQVLVAFQRKLMMTRLPGDQLPRISPNTTTSTLEVYAPEQLAREIEEYVTEMDSEIINDPVRKVHVVELKNINSAILQKYLLNLRQTNAMRYSSPYMINPYYMYNMYNQSGARGRRGL